MEKATLTKRPENLSSHSESLDWDIYQYYKFLAERGGVQIQDETDLLRHASYKGIGSSQVREGVTVPTLDGKRKSLLSSSFVPLLTALSAIGELVTIVMARFIFEISS